MSWTSLQDFIIGRFTSCKLSAGREKKQKISKKNIWKWNFVSWEWSESILLNFSYDQILLLIEHPNQPANNIEISIFLATYHDLILKMFRLLTTLHTVPGAGPNIQFGSSLEVTRSGEGKQIGRTHRLNNNGVSSRKSDMSFTIAVRK